MALTIIEEFRKTTGVQPGAYDYEYSELLLYQSSILREAGDPAAALEHLDTYTENICDRITLLERRGDLLLELGRHSEAESVYRTLLERNPENTAYYRRLFDARRLQVLEVLSTYLAAPLERVLELVMTSRVS